MSYKCVAVAPNAPGMADCTGPGPLVFAFFFLYYIIKEKVTINMPTEAS
jgi:hypothetical protein